MRSRVSLRATQDHGAHARRDQLHAGRTDRAGRADHDGRGARRHRSPISSAPRKSLRTAAAIVSELPVVTGIGARSAIVTPPSPTTPVNAPRPAMRAPSATPTSIAARMRRVDLVARERRASAAAAAARRRTSLRSRARRACARRSRGPRRRPASTPGSSRRSACPCRPRPARSGSTSSNDSGWMTKQNGTIAACFSERRGAP